MDGYRYFTGEYYRYYNEFYNETDIDSEATIRVYACNNAYDEVKSWEDMTSQYLNNEYYAFENNNKLSDSWAVSVKYVIEANNSTGEISIDAIGIGVS